MADGVLTTERLILRPAEAGDLQWILEAMNTRAVLRHLGGEPRSDETVAEALAADIAAFGTAGGHRRWTAVRRDTGEPVGRFGLFTIRSEAAHETLRGQPEIGWMLAEPFWGQGYAGEAARAVLAYAFGELGLPTVFSQTSESNAGSTRMMHRLGFTARPELGYHDPDYPDADNPTTVWSLETGDFHG